MVRPTLPPIRLAEVQAARLTIHIRCPVCHHFADVPAMELPAPHDWTMEQIGRRARCTDCGRRGGATVVPDHQGWIRYLRATGQREREPWYAVMTPRDAS